MRVIYVDDEPTQLEGFENIVKEFPDVDDYQLFLNQKEAEEFAKDNKIDIAFLDIKLQDGNGLKLAEFLYSLDENVRIIFISEHTRYAMQAFKLNAIGYILKPFTTEDIRREFDKAVRMQPKRTIDVKIETIPDFVVKVRGHVAVFSRPKVEELFALLVNQGDAGLTAGEAISYLWPDKESDESTTALYRTTASRLIKTLKSWGISDILCTDGRRRYIDTKLVDCDLYRILAGEKEPLLKYNEEYMRRYSWAEDRNAWLWHLDKEHIRED